MQKVFAWFDDLFTRTSVLITGFGIGWLLGLSVSPVVSIVITSVAGVAAAIITTMSGLKGKSSEIEVPGEQKFSLPTKINPQPIAALIIGLVVGSCVGIKARTNDWLGTNITDTSVEVKRWSATELSEKEIARRLFELEHPYTPYAEDLGWMKIDASSGITAALAAEVELWTQLGLRKEEAARRLFEMKYPSIKASLTTTTSTAASNGESFDPSKTGLSKTGLYLTEEDKQKCGDLLSYSYAAEPDGVSKFREQVRESGVDVFQKLESTIADDKMLYSTLQILC